MIYEQSIYVSMNDSYVFYAQRPHNAEFAHTTSIASSESA